MTNPSKEKLWNKYRTAWGFLLAPLIPGLLMALLISVNHSDYYWKDAALLLIGFSALLGYPVALLLGLPLFFLMKRCRWLRLYYYIFIGAILGDVSVLISDIDKLHYFGFADFLHYYLTPMHILLGAIMGMIATTSFWLIARPDRLEKSQ